MEKTTKALDEMFARLISQVWGYATSGKFWITAAGMYIGYTQAGLEGALAAVGLGGVFVAAKAYQNGKVIQAKANGQAVQPKPAMSGVIPEGVPPPDQGVPFEYADPFNPKLWGSEGKTAYERWELFEDVYTDVNFNIYNPSIRYDFADQLADEAQLRLQFAWAEAFEGAGASDIPKMPAAADFVGWSLTEKATAKLEDHLPSTCGRLSSKVHNITLLSIAIAKWYQLSENLEALWKKNIDWTKARTLSDIMRRGLGVVSQ